MKDQFNHIYLFERKRLYLAFASLDPALSGISNQLKLH